MKQLVIVRHGDYHIVELNERGRAQIGSLGRKLQPLIKPGVVVIRSSPQMRTKESAQILGPIFGVTTEADELFLSGGNVVPRFAEATAYVQALAADIVIVVTHLEYLYGWPQYFGREVLSVDFPCEKLSYGEAWLIDCEDRICLKV